ncbi:MAG: SEC-C metal-binding domain-containing protein, partial [Myxococcota bacterium]|nr:SEC-C metal-binding domain-containing protein [Myxococcota bacterium]
QQQQQAAAAAAPRRPEKGIAAKRFGIAQGVKRNDPCPCGSGQKFKKCCFKVVDPESQPGV